MSEHHMPTPVDRKLLTPGVWVLLSLMGIGVCVIVTRFLIGLAGVTHLDQQHPWGIWVAVDLATGVALAAGGFTTAALVHIFHRESYQAVSRPALLTAMLGYTFAVMGLLVDLGKPYNIWHPILPSMRNPNSVLFEVGMCVMIYLTVLYLEFMPILCERLAASRRFPRLARLCGGFKQVFEKTMFLLIIAGVVLSCAHQSSLGSLLIIAPSKVHPLWWTPLLPLLFLLSAIAVGVPMVIFESLIAARSLHLPAEMDLMSRLARYVPVVLGVYLSVKLADMLIRETYVYLGKATVQSLAFSVELLVGVVVPMLMLMSARARRSRRCLLLASSFVVVGVAINRINVFLVAYQPRAAEVAYFPALGEVAVTVSLMAALVFCYRVAVTYLPVITQPAMKRVFHETAMVVSDVQTADTGLHPTGVDRTPAQPAGEPSIR